MPSSLDPMSLFDGLFGSSSAAASSLFANDSVYRTIAGRAGKPVAQQTSIVREETSGKRERSERSKQAAAKRAKHDVAQQKQPRPQHSPPKEHFSPAAKTRKAETASDDEQQIVRSRDHRRQTELSEVANAQKLWDSPHPGHLT